MSSIPLPTPVDPASWASADWPLGAHPAGTERTTFAVAAPAATRVLLEVYAAATGVDALTGIDLARGADGVWRGQVQGVSQGALYGYRVWGPGWSVDPAWQRGGSAAGFVTDLAEGGLRFNPNKVLTDPYAREITHSIASPILLETGLDGGAFGTGGADYRGRPRREVDTGRAAPKSVVVHDESSTGTRPKLPAENAVVYEAHVRGLTRHPSSGALTTHLAGIPAFAAVTDVPEALRGTYAGAALVAPYLKALGVTTIELLPVHETVGSEIGSTSPNYWGYATVGFFAPNRAYAADQSPGGPTREFKAMVKAFHDAGLEVYLDVVYNHTGEGGQWGDLDTVGLTGLMGFATPDYYVLTDAGGLVDGATGCSNQTDASSPIFQRLVLDSLAHWADTMGVDGFRFDLAPVLGRTPDAAPRGDWVAQRGFTREHPLLTGIRDLARARDLEVIAEAWDLWGYEVGNFPDGWAEWNGRFRDGIRRYLKGDGNADTFQAMLNGDFDHFADQGGPQRSINFVDAHDGFTMLDLVSYDHKMNSDGPPFGPSDGGSDDNLSWGSNGDQGLRRQRLRNFLTVLMLSRGVPMIVAGDELGRTQNGNNNPYNLDSLGIWQNWAMAGTNAPTALPVDTPAAGADPYRMPHYRDVFGRAASPDGVNPVLVFTAYLMRLRRDHPGLRQRAYGDAVEGGSDVSYLFTNPAGTGAPGRGDRALRLRIDASGVGASDLLVLVNQADTVVDFTIPPPGDGLAWRRLIDTGITFEAGFNCWSQGSGEVIVGGYGAQPWTVVVLAETSAAAATGPDASGGPTASGPSRPAGNRTSGVVTQVAEAVAETVRDWLRR